MSSRWAAVPHQTVPEQLADTLRQLRRNKDKRFAPALAAARAHEWGVPALAVALGMSPAAVAQRICRANRARDDGDMRGQDLAGVDIPTSRVSAIPPPGNSQRGPAIDEATAAHLHQLHAQHQLVRCNLPFDHWRRRASAHLAVDVDFLLKNRGIRVGEVSRVLGVTGRAVHQLLERHGLKTPPPSFANKPGHVFTAYTGNQRSDLYVAAGR